jgi:hypothetical protein
MFYAIKGSILLLLLACDLQAVGLGEYPCAYEPDPSRFAKQVDAYLVADSINFPTFGGIVCIGSSSMRMWHPRIESDLAGLSLVARGFGGSHYSDVIYFADVLILKYAPRALVIYEGDNDAAYGKSVQRIFNDLKYLIQLCRKRLPDLRFYIIGAKPSLARWDIAQEMQAANAMIKDYCQDRLGITYIDVWPALLNASGMPRAELFTKDGLHLNKAGYNAWSAVIAPILRQAEAGFESF